MATWISLDIHSNDNQNMQHKEGLWTKAYNVNNDI